MAGTIKVDEIQNFQEKTFIEDTVNGPKINHLKPNIIFRDGTTSTSLLPLEKMNEVHVYATNTRVNNIYISSSVVEDALYEVLLFFSLGDTNNCDPRLYPNNTSYSNQFSQRYFSTEQSNGQWITRSQTQNEFYFDHQNGALGRSGFNRWVICTKRNSKYVQFEGMDSGPSLSCGYGRWINTTTVWSWIGRIYYGPANGDVARAYVRRIG